MMLSVQQQDLRNRFFHCLHQSHFILHPFSNPHHFKKNHSTLAKAGECSTSLSFNKREWRQEESTTNPYARPTQDHSYRRRQSSHQSHECPNKLMSFVDEIPKLWRVNKYHCEELEDEFLIEVGSKPTGRELYLVFLLFLLRVLLFFLISF